MKSDKLKVAIITSSQFGTAAFHLPYLMKNESIEICLVIYCNTSNSNSNFKKKFKKIIKIGLLGAINGIRMRKWFNQDVDELTKSDSVSSFCTMHNINYVKTSKLNSPFTIGELKRYNPDLGLSLGNGYISEGVFKIPLYGMINVHHEILPQYQNAQSIIWQLFNNSKNTGYTIHKIDKKIDTGSIIYQEFVPIQFKKSLRLTVSHTSVNLLTMSALGINEVLSDWSKYSNLAIPQTTGTTYTTPSIWQFFRIYLNFLKLKSS